MSAGRHTMIRKQFNFISCCLVALLCMASLAGASVQLEFTPTVGGDPGSMAIDQGSMRLSFGDMTLLGMPSGSPLENAYMELSDITIGAKLEDYSAPFMNSALYAISWLSPSPEMRVYSAGDQLIMSGYISVDTLLTVGSSVFISPETGFEVTGVQVFLQSIPAELMEFAQTGTADIKIEMSSAGSDFTDNIDAGQPMENIQSTTTLTSTPVPEPGVAMLFGAGLVWLRSRIKKRF